MGLDSIEKLDVIKGLRQMGYGGCFATAIKDMEHKLAAGGFVETDPPSKKELTSKEKGWKEGRRKAVMDLMDQGVLDKKVLFDYMNYSQDGTQLPGELVPLEEIEEHMRLSRPMNAIPTKSGQINPNQIEEPTPPALLMANGGFIKTRAPQRYVGGVHQDRENRSALMEGDLAQYEVNTRGAFSTSSLADGGPLRTDGPRAIQEQGSPDRTGMMKARIAYEGMHGNPAASRMTAPTDNPYQFGNGYSGTHYMASMDNYAVPGIQQEGNQLVLNEDFGPSSSEAMRFDSSEDADYFAKNYKKVAPALKHWGGFVK